MIRSMSDEQMQTKYGYDKEQRMIDSWPNSGPPAFPPARPECIPSPDPLPWTWGNVETPVGYVRQSWSDHWHRGFKPRPWGTFTPDPEFVRPEVNPILSAFREDNSDLEMWDLAFRQFAIFGGYTTWLAPDHAFYSFTVATEQQVESARRVLTRLRNVTEATVAHEHRPGYHCPACGHLALRQMWMGPIPDQENLAHQRLAGVTS